MSPRPTSEDVCHGCDAHAVLLGKFALQDAAKWVAGPDCPYGILGELGMG